jgi:hypothetical protein
MATFSIEVTEARVNVRTSDVQPRFNLATIFAALFLWGLGAYILAQVIPALVYMLSMPHNYDFWTWLLISVMLWVGLVFVWRGFRDMFPSGESLVCDGTTLTLGHIPDHVLNGRWEFQKFPTESVRQVSFGTVRVSRYGGIPGLIFTAEGKKKKVLAGLEAPEADQVLNGLSHLGVDTVHDAAMPMMIEMVMSRRKSRLGLF